jgi:hypothetical protein
MTGYAMAEIKKNIVVVQYYTSSSSNDFYNNTTKCICFASVLMSVHIVCLEMKTVWILLFGG